MLAISIPRHISLVTSEALPQDTVRCWFHCVKNNGPTGVLMSIPSTDDKGMPRTVSLVHREENGEHLYMVPLSRDLNESEGEAIVQAFAAENPELDFDVRASANAAEQIEGSTDEVAVDHNAYLTLCDAWAKRQHEDWVKDRTDNGWSYGTVFSVKDKKHPLLRPWDQLPDKFKKIDLEHPQMLLDLLNDQGYAVISRSELESIMKLIRISQV